MASSAEPSDADLDLFCDITGLDRQQAVTRLKANGNQLQQAVEEYYENPDSKKYQYDESQFAMGRDGEANDAGMSFAIQALDELPPASYHGSAAPTRPPSRVNNRPALGAPASRDQEDADLQQALAASAAESGVPPQESGVTDDSSNPKYFGPANRADYDASQWAMVPTQPAASSARTGPAPSARKRETGAPVLLRNTKDSRLGPLVTILHEIPLVRNILLSYGLPSRSYGHNSEWWEGKPILTAEELAALNTGDIWADSPRPHFGEELHRLMAFLDQTSRAYAVVDALAETKEMNPEYSWVSDWESLLFQTLKDADQSNPDYDVGPLLLRGRILPVTTNPPESLSELQIPNETDENSIDFAFLDVSLDVDAYSWVNTLYDALDHLMWSDALSANSTYPDDSKMAVLEKPSEVITIRLGGTGLVKPCGIPAVFYADRYLASRKDVALHAQNQIREIRGGLRKIASWEQQLVQDDGNQINHKFKWRDAVHDVRDSYRRMIQMAEILLQQQTHDGQFRRAERLWDSGHSYSMEDIRILHAWAGPYELTPEEETKRKQYEKVIDVAKAQIEKVDQDLLGLQEQRKMLLDMLAMIGRRLTGPDDEGNHKPDQASDDMDAHSEHLVPTHRYLLRGVALTNDLSFVCTRQRVEADGMEDGGVDQDQWWKLAFSTHEKSPAKVERVTLDEVLQSAATESRTPILVYATETALATDSLQISDSLRMFVRADNRTFQHELSQEAEHQQQQAIETAGPVSGITSEALAQLPGAVPGKRKLDAASSVATNQSVRSNLAEVDLDFTDEPYAQASGDKGPSVKHAEFAVEPEGASRYVDPARVEGDIQMSESSQRFSGAGPPIAETGLVEDAIGDVDVPKEPEMQQKSGVAPFFARQSATSQQSATEEMDIDMDEERRAT